MVKRGMQRNLAAWVALCACLGAVCAVAQGKGGPAEKKASPVRGRVVDEAGNPIERVLVEVYSEPGHEILDRAKTSASGAYELHRLPATGTFSMRFSGKNCFTMVRKMVTRQFLLDEGSRPWTMICCDPGMAITPHPKTAPQSPEHYAGLYKVQTTCRTCSSTGSVALLLVHEGPDARRCTCSAPGQMAVLGPNEKCPSRGCWRVTPDGAVRVSFPCDGIGFGATEWVLWEDKGVLDGYTTGWTDCGCPPPTCRITLTPTVKK